MLHLKRGSTTRDLPITSVLDADEGQVICAAGRAGLGILVQPLYIIYDDIVAGRLVPVLADWELPRLTINLAYQSRTHQPAKIRVFVDHWVGHFRELDLERKWTAAP